MNASAWATFVAGARHELCSRSVSPGEQRRVLAEFDQMIAVHNLTIAERAWDEGYDAGEIDVMDHGSPHAVNPYHRRPGWNV